MDDKPEQEISEETERLMASIWELAQGYQEDSRSLLIILRLLEQLHWQIREKLFHPALPNTRHELYQLLRDIEENGGWPHIERMRLRSLLIHLEFSEEHSTPDNHSSTDS